MDIELKKRYEARAEIIKAMAHPSRLYMVDILSRGERCVGDLTDMIEADMSTISKHLNILRTAGIVEVRKEGTRMYYRLKVPCVLNFFGCVETVLKESGSELIKLSSR